MTEKTFLNLVLILSTCFVILFLFIGVFFDFNENTKHKSFFEDIPWVKSSAIMPSEVSEREVIIMSTHRTGSPIIIRMSEGVLYKTIIEGSHRNSIYKSSIYWTPYTEEIWDELLSRARDRGKLTNIVY